MLQRSQGGAAHFYTGEEGRIYCDRLRTPHPDILSRCFAAKVGRWIVQEDRVFEYGVGSGRNLLSLAVQEKAGYDISEHARAMARGVGLHVYDTIDEIPRQYWSVVICHHVLEHIPSPLDTLRLLKELLSQQGRLIVTIPLEASSRSMKQKDRDPDHHLYCWNPTTLQNLVECADFVPCSIQVRTAAREDVFAAVAGYSWRAFTFFVWCAGVLLRRGEVTILAARA